MCTSKPAERDPYTDAAARWQDRNPAVDMRDIPERCLLRGCTAEVMAPGLVWTNDGRAWRVCISHGAALA